MSDQMKIRIIPCVSCGESISLPAWQMSFACTFCHTEQSIDPDAGRISSIDLAEFDTAGDLAAEAADEMDFATAQLRLGELQQYHAEYLRQGDRLRRENGAYRIIILLAGAGMLFVTRLIFLVGSDYSPAGWGLFSVVALLTSVFAFRKLVKANQKLEELMTACRTGVAQVEKEMKAITRNLDK